MISPPKAAGPTAQRVFAITGPVISFPREYDAVEEKRKKRNGCLSFFLSFLSLMKYFEFQRSERSHFPMKLFLTCHSPSPPLPDSHQFLSILSRKNVRHCFPLFHPLPTLCLHWFSAKCSDAQVSPSTDRVNENVNSSLH